MSERIDNEAIAASAGAGKTFQLAHRYIRLMAGGVLPDRICALTFSRLAAGEIFDSIVGYLRDAAAADEGARAAGERIGKPLDRAEFLRLLRQFVDGLHRLHIGTLDSFIIGVVRAFPVELGIAADFQVMNADGSAARELREQVLSQLFNPGVVGADDRRDFFEAFKQATFGLEEKGMTSRLDTFIDNNRPHFLLLPEAAAWGRRERIWPQGSPWLQPVGEADEAMAQLGAWLAEQELPEKVRGRWTAFIAAAGDLVPGMPWPKEFDYLFAKLAPVVADLRSGSAEVKLERSVCLLSAAACRAALVVMGRAMAGELQAHMERTQGMYRVLSQYETLYDDTARRLGRFTFDDAQYLLSGAPAGGGLRPSRNPDGRLYIDYRLDCQLDHWLLDEFQDTSDLQWTALGNLVDEVLQDDGGGRSFFYVGDVKQAIYSWRGGNPRLFASVLEQYADRIVPRPLSTSFRSCEPVIEFVNDVFEDLGGSGLPAGAIERWQSVWQRHQCATGSVPASGYAAILEPPVGADGEKPTAADRYRLVAAILREIDPLARGLSVAVLVRSNEQGRRAVDELRRACPDLAIVHEGRASILDSSVVAVLLALVRYAAHPGDTLAWRHLCMSPLAPFVDGSDAERDELPLRVLASIHAHGFQETIRAWGRRLDDRSPLDAFGRRRLDDLAAAAAAFDAGGGRDVNSFLRFVEAHEIHEQGVAGAVRVMTVHQSKGLGFDVVLLPDLVTGGIDKSRRQDLVMSREREHEDRAWALRMPRRVVADRDAVLAAAARRADETASFDELCVLYVALTRARHALYVISSYPGKASVSLTAAAFVKRQLLGDRAPGEPPPAANAQVGAAACARLHAVGDPEWYAAVPAAPPPADLGRGPGLPPDFADRPSRRSRLAAVEPSAEEAMIRKAASLFDPETRDVLDFGRAIHALFEAIAWIDDADAEAIVADWLAASADRETVKRDACEQFRRAMSADEVRQALARPPGRVELWREKHFEIVLDDEWITGTFDRVTIVRDDAGRAVQATVLDYKSNRIADEAGFARAVDHYRRQLELYGRVVMRILGLDASSVDLRLLFTRAGRVFDVR